MAVRNLSAASAPVTRVTAAVGVVGGGIAGLLAAVRLARGGRRVVVIESGPAGEGGAFEALNELEDVSGSYAGTIARARGLGGTSRLWAGKMLPLSPHDRAARPYLEIPAWPLSDGELEIYLPELESLLGVDLDSYEEEATAKLDRAGLLPRSDQGLALRWPKRPRLSRHNLATVLRREIESAENLEIWTEATVTGFTFDREAGRLRELSATGPAGRELKIEAAEFLLAAGTLESTRLLLLADRQVGGGLFRDCAVLGRYFNEHLGVVVATVRRDEGGRVNRALGDRFTAQGHRHLHFELRPDVQEQGRVGSGYADIGLAVPEASVLPATRRLIGALRRGRRWAEGDAGTVLRGLPTLARTAQWQAIRGLKYWPPDAVAELKLWIEQTPRRRNRLELGEGRDALGQPKLRVDWEKGETEERTLRLLAEEADRYWRRHAGALGILEWKENLFRKGSRLVDAAVGQAHPAGSTRMGLDPRESIVDPFLKVHALGNVSVASASVFPSSGSANPTLTVMQLALRAADAIARRLEKGS